jgi:hypothetical protein
MGSCSLPLPRKVANEPTPATVTSKGPDVGDRVSAVNHVSAAMGVMTRTSGRRVRRVAAVELRGC